MNSLCSEFCNLEYIYFYSWILDSFIDFVLIESMVLKLNLFSKKFFNFYFHLVLIAKFKISCVIDACYKTVISVLSSEAAHHMEISIENIVEIFLSKTTIIN